LVRAAVRRAVLRGTHATMGSDLVDDATRDLARAAQTDERARLAFCHVATARLGLSQREVARRLGVSHVQVGRWLRHQPASAPNETQKRTETTR
uniref:helix-turn-helix domain-containing protein n=1 Tax=Gemmatimonas sp. TaxID=1962908 RepID=UPI00286A805D